jgi:hypothetical protein
MPLNGAYLVHALRKWDDPNANSNRIFRGDAAPHRRAIIMLARRVRGHVRETLLQRFRGRSIGPLRPKLRDTAEPRRRGPGNDCVSRSSPQAGSRPSSSLPHVLCQEYRGVEVRKLCRGLPGAREISMVFVVVMVYARDTSCTGCTLISESPCQHRPLYD